MLSSHPSWVCGLKLFEHSTTAIWMQSHPSWVCGLKQTGRSLGRGLCSHTLRGCVDWNSESVSRWSASRSHTLRGCVDWNSSLLFDLIEARTSHPSWVCGLKLLPCRWLGVRALSHPSWVCGLKPWCVDGCDEPGTSHPSWVCGLKLKRHLGNLASSIVTPFVGVWIETSSSCYLSL